MRGGLDGKKVMRQGSGDRKHPSHQKCLVLAQHTTAGMIQDGLLSNGIAKPAWILRCCIHEHLLGPIQLLKGLPCLVSGDTTIDEHRKRGKGYY